MLLTTIPVTVELTLLAAILSAFAALALNFFGDGLRGAMDVRLPD